MHVYMYNFSYVEIIWNPPWYKLVHPLPVFESHCMLYNQLEVEKNKVNASLKSINLSAIYDEDECM